jgi:hypothetical protein
LLEWPTSGIRSLRSYDNLEPIYYTHQQKHEFGAMDPNFKLVLDKMVKLHAEIKGFTGQEAVTPGFKIKTRCSLYVCL